MSAIIIISQAVQRIGSPILGIIIPAVIFIISSVVTWLLYRHFTKQ